MVGMEGGPPLAAGPGEADEADPTWSPDGLSLLFASLPRPGRQPQSLVIRLLDLQTRRVSILPGSEGLSSPRWSPDGRYAVATSGDSQKLVLYNFRTKVWSDLAIVNAGWQNWSRDGESVFFDSTYRNDPGIYRIRISDRKMEQVESLKGVQRALGVFGPWSGLAPDESPLILRDVGTQDIYALDWEAP